MRTVTLNPIFIFHSNLIYRVIIYAFGHTHTHTHNQPSTTTTIDMRRLRSRAIWDETRRPHDNVLDWAIAYGRALLYEIQPIRFRTLQVGITDVVQFIQQLFNVIQVLATKWIPSVTYHVAVFVWNRPLRQWCYVGLAVLYYGFVRWIHE